MANWEQVVEAVSAGMGASIGLGALIRRWFRKAVKDVVAESVEDFIERQIAMERRQSHHLNRQDQKLSEIEKMIRGLRTGAA